jgi:beta-lactamase class A
MTLHRRTVIAATPALLLAASAWAQGAPAPIAAYEKTAKGRVGLYAKNLDNGRELTWRADERFVMCSTFKASLAGCVLSRVDKGQETLDRVIAYGEKDIEPYAPVAKENLARGGMTVQAMCKAAVELSDNTCANKLLEAIGGPAALTRFWRETGDTISRLDHNEPLLNRSKPGDPHDTTTPRAMADSVRRLVLGKVLKDGSRERLTTWMLDCQTGANRLRAGLPTGWMIGDKTGNNGADACGDIAVAWPEPGSPVLIVCYVQGGQPKPADQDALFAAVGRLVGERLRL